MENVELVYGMKKILRKVQEMSLISRFSHDTAHIEAGILHGFSLTFL